jgi:hypothetical protein
MYARTKQAVACTPPEFSNKSIVKPKRKLAINNPDLFVFTG